MGERNASEENLTPVARALGFPVAFFFGAEVERLPADGISFRALTKMTAAERERSVSAAEMALMAADWLKAGFDLPEPQLPELSGADPEHAAGEVRAAWGLGLKSIDNMVHMLESKGVRAFSLSEPSLAVNGLSFWRGGEPFVFLNTMKSAESSRFDAAHELGHLVLHRHGQALGRQAETEAHAFAAAFLMPRDSVMAHAPRIPDLSALVEAKQWWGVSVAALVHRLGRLKILTEWHTTTLWKQIQLSGFRTAEPNPMPREHSRIWQTVFGWLADQGLNRFDLAERLGHWPVRELRGLVFQLVLSADTGGNADNEIVTRTLKLVR